MRLMREILRTVGVVALTVFGLCTEASAEASAQQLSAAAVDFFESHIRPVLVAKCYECHSQAASSLKGGLSLDSAAAVLRGGDTGPVIVPHKPEESVLLAALRYETYEMPPSGKLPDEVVADFDRWIAMGAPDPRGEETGEILSRESASGKDHWAFHPPVQPRLPLVANDGWPRIEIDRFILEQLEMRGLAPSMAAAPREMLRRLFYDLVGLPPSADEMAAFAADPSETHYGQIVDQLLDSPRFGERWGRHWLDLARYADTKGYLFEEDRTYPGAYKYRDWVIGSFNGDLPYDRFLVAQLAADQLDDPTFAPAMGFLTLGRRFLNDPHDIADDRIDVVSRGMLGLTVACARCHDHKYAPISQSEYYGFYGVFSSSKETPRDGEPPMLVEGDAPADAAIFLRGNPGNPGPKAPRQFLACLSEATQEPFKTGSGRLELAQAIASSDNPLTARVWVNRVWDYLLGRPLVGTPSDFGARSDPPSHPELLDWLATTFMDDGWSTKRLIRRIVLSSTYRQSSAAGNESLEVDPENRWLSHATRSRLDLEAFRDSLLVAAGRLDETMGGPSVQLTTAPFTARRSVYGYIERQNLPAFFRTFDFANPNAHTPLRAETVSPQQALFALNSPFVWQQAQFLAERSERPVVDSESTKSEPREATRIVRMFRFTYGRDPTPDELFEASAFVSAESQDQSAEALPSVRWAELAQVLLMSNEFVFVD